MPTTLDPLLNDPLWQQYYALGQQVLAEESPEMEVKRKERALGSLTDTLAGRYARAGYTGSSPELDALQTAASNFELDWSERAPARRAFALRAADLPITNLEQMIKREAEAGGTYRGLPTEEARQFDVERVEGRRTADVQLISKVLSSLGIPQWLARELFGIGAEGWTAANIRGPGEMLTLRNLAEEWAALGAPTGLDWLTASPVGGMMDVDPGALMGFFL